MERVPEQRGNQKKIRLDNSLEMLSVSVARWAEMHGVALGFSEPGKPSEKLFIEWFNRVYWTEL